MAVTTLTITAKGQVTLKQSLLKHLGVGPGQKIEAEKLPDGRIIVSAAEQNGTVEDFIGCLAQVNTPPLSIDEINELAAQGWAGEK
jgi:bifunctional DNA-binding transcriptional regulator/antitoxin component of YhaV-PrlF toxin-antitoxin module